jgi:diguanylate cyclase (GGDEF)-like protein
VKDWLTKRFWQKADESEIDERVRAALVATLFGSPGSLAIGALCGSLGGLFIASRAHSLAIDVTAIILSTISAVRIWTAFAYIGGDSAGNSKSRRWEILYEAGAWSYALMLGLVMGLTVLFAADTTLHVLATANVVGYAAGISGRNAGRPSIAIGQLLLTTFPFVIALWLVGSTSYLVLLGTTVLFVSAMVSITFKTYRIVHQSFAMAQEKADLATEMERRAQTDALTGLNNRAGLNARLADIFRDRGENPVALLWLDLDRFKEVNDSLGHPVGDKLLIIIAQRLNQAMRKHGSVARFGGDEFVIVCPGANTKMAQRIATKILRAASQPFRIDGHLIAISASVGIAVAPVDGPDGETIMQHADLALYHSKASGRNKASLFDPSMNRALVRRKELESELRSAIERNQLELHYQPIVDITSGRIVAFEALVRWFHPERGSLRPDEFIPIAEETGLIITLGNWIAGEACRTAVHWPAHISVCVNVSPIQMQAAGASLGIMAALKSSGLDPKRLELEITETVFIDENDQIREFVAVIDEAGIRMALDDFGTGYSSLSYLHKYNFSKIKVDRSFVSGPLAGKKSDAIIKAVAELARTLDMTVVAEGIETREQMKAVHLAGCRQGQGYLFGAAMPADQALRLIESGTTLESGALAA